MGVVGIPTARIGSCVTWLPPLVGAGFAISRLRSRLTKPALITGLRVIDETLSPASVALSLFFFRQVVHG